MEQKKCSSKDHSESNAIIYCIECKIYMCNKCEKYHSVLFANHHQYSLDKIINDVFTGFCIKNKHYIEFNYYCKTHNELVCPACIAKIKDDGLGQHTDCDVQLIKEIKDEKRNKLKENINILEDLSKALDKSINELKVIFDKISKNKEELVLNVQKIFTKIRNVLNEREDKLILEIEKKFNEIYFEEDLLRNIEKLPNKVKMSLDKGKLIDKEWKDNELNMMLYDCINIENNINYINEINQKINKFNSNNNRTIEFNPKEEGINQFLETIKKFGIIDSPIFKFKKCPPNINGNRKYTISGEKENIFTKNGFDGYWTPGLCEYELDKNREYKWKIKILKTQNKYILVGVTPIDFDVNQSDWQYGWYFYCSNSCLYSGPPYNYSGKGTNLSGVKDEVIIVMNMSKRTLKFIINNEDKGESYNDIPIEKPIVPIVLLHCLNDSVEITEC